MTLLYFHGGGYLSCSPQTHRPNTVTLTRLLKADTYVPGYRLAPEHPFPAAIDDAMSVYRAICASGASAVVLAGDSAGGGLAIATAIRARDENLPLPSSILTFSPWVDLTPGREAQLRPREHLDDMFYATSFWAYADAYLQGADPRSPLASPLFADLSKTLAPLLIEISDTELLYPEAVQLHERWGKAGNGVELNVSAGLPHGWQEVTPFLPEARESLARAAEFALKHRRYAAASSSAEAMPRS
ncbi:MAG: alpha/beta hydrolase [Chthoniobacterales bacterium]